MNKQIAFLSVLLVAGNAVASNHDNPWYVGGRIGATHYSDFEQSQSGRENKDNDDIGGGLFLGFNINDWFAIETGYTYLGEFEIGDNASVINHAGEVVGKFTWEATEDFDVFAKAGIYGYQAKGNDDISELRKKGLDGTLGLGAEYHFTEDFSARLEYQFYNELAIQENNNEITWDAHLLALGLVYSWGKPEAIVIQDAPVTQAVEVEEVVEEIMEEKIEPVVVVVEEKKAIEVENATAEIYFDTKSNSISAESIAQLQPIINHLSDHPSATIIAVGHTDSRGSEASNQKLSERRAEALSNFLVEEYSIDPARISYSGEGEHSPIADNETKEGQAKNRRVSVFSPSFFVVED